MCLETVEDSNFQNCSKGVDVRGALVPRALDAYQGTITEIWIYKLLYVVCEATMGMCQIFDLQILLDSQWPLCRLQQR